MRKAYNLEQLAENRASEVYEDLSTDGQSFEWLQENDSMLASQLINDAMDCLIDEIKSRGFKWLNLLMPLASAETIEEDLEYYGGELLTKRYKRYIKGLKWKNKHWLNLKQ